MALLCKTIWFEALTLQVVSCVHSTGVLVFISVFSLVISPIL